MENLPQKTELAIANFNGNEFPAEQTEFYRSLEILQKKIDNRLMEFRIAKPEDLSTQEIKLSRATLNKVYKFVNDAKIKMKKEWDGKLNAYTLKFAEILDSVIQTKKNYDETFEKREIAFKTQKKKELEEFYNEVNIYGSLLPFDEIMDEDWLNKTYEMEQAKADMEAILERMKNALAEIEKSELQSGLKKYCKFRLFQTLSLDTAFKETGIFAESLVKINEMEA